MHSNTGWNWKNVDDGFWATPSEEVYYLLHRWKNSGFENLLDLGCGIGRHSVFFAENGFRVTGYDLSDSGLNILEEQARKRGLDIGTVRGNFNELPFEGESFDTVLAFHSIYHLDSEGMKNVIRELARVTKPGGEIYLTLISKNSASFNSPDCVVVDEHVRMKKEEEGSVLPHYFVDYKDIRELFARFEILSVRQIEDIYDGRSSWPYFVLLRK